MFGKPDELSLAALSVIAESISRRFPAAVCRVQSQVRRCDRWTDSREGQGCKLSASIPVSLAKFSIELNLGCLHPVARVISYDIGF
jgi:hypothetical protein